ncbi:SURF1 family protein [Glaciecola sp. MF2-115]|uniref:SURF1 family protein n=1 Tax=Glaciecola sp. MF2-115 TaxID=3384827 RepID=UPI0039A06FAD
MWIRKLPILPTLITLLCVVIMFGLGIWQLERKAEKDERLLQIAERQLSQPYSLEEIIANLPRNSNASSVIDIQDFPVSFTGLADLDKVFFIDNKIVNGKTGYHVVIPITTSSGTTVLANFGWLRGNGIRGELPNLPIELHDYEVAKMQFSGVVSMPSINQMVTETNKKFGEFPALLQQIDLTQIEKHLSALAFHPSGRTYPFVVNLNPDPNTEFVRNWQAVVMSPEKHLGYAAQWFGLGIAALTIYLLSLMKLTHTKNNKEK